MEGHGQPPPPPAEAGTWVWEKAVQRARQRAFAEDSLRWGPSIAFSESGEGSQGRFLPGLPSIPHAPANDLI